MYSSRMIASAAALCLLMLTALAPAQQTGPVQIAGKPADVQYPFIGEVTGNDVYIRAGNSLNDYFIGKVDRGFRVTVVEDVLGWAKILPPDGTYSWIHKSFVNVTSDKPDTGVLTGDNVRVWAGSDYKEPMHSSTLQTKLSTGEIVELMPDQPIGGEYYKIKPPAGAHLYISSEYVRYAAPIQRSRPVVVPARPVSAAVPADLPPSNEQSRPRFQNLDRDGTEPNEVQPETVVPVETQAPVATRPAPTPTPQPVSKESQLLKQGHEISAKIDEEAKKPLKEQNYAEIKKSLEGIKADPEAGRAALVAQVLIERVERFELAISVTDTLNQQDKSLEQIREQIERARQAQLQRIPKEPDYLYTGTLQASNVYTDRAGEKRYILLDTNGRIICYVAAGTPEAAAALDRQAGKKTGIRGKLISTPNSSVKLVSAEAADPLP